MEVIPVVLAISEGGTLGDQFTLDFIVILNKNETLFCRKTSICRPLQQKRLSQSKLK